jgi:putative Mg2+ transporter-C (MgtC) family protein
VADGAVEADAGAGLLVLGALSTAIYLLVALSFPVVIRRLPHSATALSAVRVQYLDGQGILRRALQTTTAQGFVVDELSWR